MQECITGQEYLGVIQHWATRTLEGRSDRAQRIIPHWIRTREIRITWEDGITNATAQAVAQAIHDRLEEVALCGFEVQLYGTGWNERGGRVSVSNYIRPALDHNGAVLFKKLFELSYRESYRQARQHADLYITNRPFHDDQVSWGAAMFEYGASVLTLHGGRQNNRSFLRKVVRHEIGHLLGMPIHCEMIKVSDVPELNYDPSCNMHYSVPSGELCTKCRLFLHEWWRIIQQRT